MYKKQMQNKESPQQKLPIFKYKDQIIKKIQSESAIVISGLTGCGKSTQVPQYLLDAYPEATIAVCEPRRLAATSLALRVCDQRKSRLGWQVGYQIGLESKRSEKTKLIYMTYGILIQQLLFKENLDYDFIILDEVHERSLQMDFAFVILKKIINQNIKLKMKQSEDKILQKTQQKSQSQAQQKPQQKSQQKSQQKDQQQIEQKSQQKTEQTFQKSKLKETTQLQSIKKSQVQQPKKQEQTKIIKAPPKKLKLIIMSATLNSQQFQKYFAVHKKTSLIIEPDVIIKNPQQISIKTRRGTREVQRKRGNVDWDTVIDSKKQVSITYSNLQEYRQGICIFINEKSLYNVQEYYLDDFLAYFQQKMPNRNYDNKDQIRLDQKHYDWGYKLIQKAHRDIQYARKNAQQNTELLQETGDILVFLPGLVQINRMKQILIRSNKLFIQKIVEVHSLFSEELYYKLFKSKIKNKIILATNIGQSSITLPNCKVVIDYCLNRKAVKNNIQGISRFSTSIASLSNLIQRKGRVGRVSDGIVYRMITKAQFQKLEEFDVPEIKCVSLDMAILKTKKLQSTSKSHIFEDIYDIFLNVLQPPQISSIETSIDNLIHQDALQYVLQRQTQTHTKQKNKKSQKKKINSGKKYDPRRLKITKVGEFMVSMPCDLGISKLILMGIKLGISSMIIDIAAIILSTKSFFCHEQRRYNSEEFMHSIIGYDKGYNNDYILRQQLFDHWRTRFFYPFRQKQRKNQPKPQPKPQSPQTSFRIFDINDQVVEFDQNYKIVDYFARRQQSEEQNNFCKNRGVYGNHMRELLRVSETLKIRIQLIGVEKQKLNSFQPQAQLVLICLMYAFPDIICEVTFDAKKRQISHYFDGGSNFSNKVHIPMMQWLDKRQLEEYLNPQRNFQVKQQRNSLMISTYDHVLKKFFLPKYYLKAPIQKCSLLYKHCKQSKINYPYEYNIHHGFSSIIVLNESINKQIFLSKQMLFHNRIESKYLISNNLIESKGKYMVGANALVSHFQLVIISMIVKKNIKLFLHPSGQFFSHISLNDKRFQIPLLLTQQQLALINNLRQLSKRKKQQDISSYKQQFNKQQLQTLSQLFKFNNLKNAQQDWQQIFIEQQQKARQQKQKNSKNSSNHYSYYGESKTENWIPIEEATNKIRFFDSKEYYQRYNDWKYFLFQSSQRQIKLYSTQQPILICGFCHAEKKLVQVASAHCFQFHTRLLKLNRYSGSWQCPESKGEDVAPGQKIYCVNKHHIGNSLNPDYAEIDLSNIFLYIPFNQVYLLKKFDCIESYLEILNQAKTEGLKSLRRQQQKFDEYECKICFTKQHQRKIFDREQVGNKKQKRDCGIKDPLWNAVINHTVSSIHINNRQRLKKSIIWN